MSYVDVSSNPLTEIALRLSQRVGYLLLLAVLSVSAAWFVALPVLGLSLLLIGLTFLALALTVMALCALHQRRQDAMIRMVHHVSDHDGAASFATDADGMIRYQNRAATEAFGDQLGATLAGAVKDMFAAPASVLFRLQNKAQAKGAAYEDVVLRRGHVRLSVHVMDGGGYLWRMEDFGERGQGTRSAEHISLPMMTVSKSGTILFMNESARRLLGGRETTLDRVFSDLPVQAGTVVQVSARNGPVPAFVCELEISAGRREIYLLPPPGGPVITDEEWAFIERLPVPLIKLDTGGVIVLANRRARALLGDEAAIGTQLADQVEGLGRPVSEWLREAHAGRHLGRVEVVRAVKPDEDVFLQISLGQVADDTGRALVAVLQDATELKTLEAQFVQSQKMEAIGQLAGGVAHDFNNLLTAISGHCDLLLLGRDENDPEYSDLSQIHQNANRAAALVRQLLAFSRKQTLCPEKLALTDSLSDLTHLLNRLVGEKVSLDLDHDLDLKPIRADRRQLDQVIMNLVVNARDAMNGEGEIRVETRNVTIDQPLHRDRATVPPGAYVTIRVIDQGTGIPADKLSKIFEPFFTTKGAGKGTGLGLSMAYGIVKQMGGFIFVDSIPGAGSTFTLYFPVCQDTDQLELAPLDTEDEQVELSEAVGDDPIRDTLDALSANDQILLDGASASVTGAEGAASSDALARNGVVDATAAAPPGLPDAPTLPMPTHALKDGKDNIVLLVEDEAPVRAFASRALRMRGFTVLEAENAEEALKTLEDTTLSVDVFVTDVIMPGMDGPTWVAKALEDRPGVKVVFVSGYAEDSVSEHQSRIPNSVFLPKPFSLTDLTATVQRQLH
ncbi:ATP-binding protein [Aliiroseovarius sp. S2029]|uniref:hybrid sensor histidine kinase/response regulator n=1 Tax=Aliiroseovarius sp. S2029 TaxID=2936988 RepID=UPI0020BF3505|nr:ATP-binding protein [Aliiroseovarius sp. S2029]